MRAKHWLTISIIALLADLLTLHLNNPVIRLITKPMIVLPLIGFVISVFKRITTPQKYFLLIALISSWLGDLFLLFENKNTEVSLVGIACFLVAQICYSIVFANLKRKNSGWQWLIVFCFFVYGVAMFMFIKSHLEEGIKLAVLAYMLVICTMLIMSFHIEKSITQKLIAMGAVLFVLSDSVLANEMFNHKMVLGNHVVMLLYGLAQMLITLGVIEHWDTKNWMKNASN
jgi:uncharacterized membrane protein YhhN